MHPNLTLFLLRITYFRYIQVVTKYERKTTSKLRSGNTSHKLTTLYVTVKIQVSTMFLTSWNAGTSWNFTVSSFHYCYGLIIIAYSCQEDLICVNVQNSSVINVTGLSNNSLRILFIPFHPE